MEQENVENIQEEQTTFDINNDFLKASQEDTEVEVNEIEEVEEEKENE